MSQDFHKGSTIFEAASALWPLQTTVECPSALLNGAVYQQNAAKEEDKPGIAPNLHSNPSLKQWYPVREWAVLIGAGCMLIRNSIPTLNPPQREAVKVRKYAPPPVPRLPMACKQSMNYKSSINQSVRQTIIQSTRRTHRYGDFPLHHVVGMGSKVALVELFTGTPVFNKAYGNEQPVRCWLHCIIKHVEWARSDQMAPCTPLWWLAPHHSTHS